MSDGGAAKHSFHHKGVILAIAKNGSTCIDTSLEHAIEAGAEDVELCDEEQKVFNVCWQNCSSLTVLSEFPSTV